MISVPFSAMAPSPWLFAPLALFSIGLLVALSRRRARVLAELRRSIEALGEGRPARPIQGHYPGELGRLARSVNANAPLLEERIARLEADRHQLRVVLGAMTEGVVAIDARRRMLFANDAAQGWFGLTAESVGRRLDELVRVPSVIKVVEATLGQTGPYQAELTIAHGEGRARGSERTIAVLGAPLPGAPPAGAVLVFHDVTETRRLERVRQDFVANASHELKTPLTSIKAYTETLLDWALHDEGVNVTFLRRIEEQADRLNRLVMDLLSLARLESGQEFYVHGPLRAAGLMRQAAEAHRDRAEAGGLRFETVIGEGAEAVVVNADEEALRQVLDNLIDNAIKYTPEGGRVRVALSRPYEDEVAIEVIDTGIGIPREDLPRVFERFYRVDKARSRELGGTGLGLSIVKHLVQSLGGLVTVESRVGSGSTFTVRLPATRAAVPTEMP